MDADADAKPNRTRPGDPPTFYSIASPDAATGSNQVPKSYKICIQGHFSLPDSLSSSTCVVLNTPNDCYSSILDRHRSLCCSRCSQLDNFRMRYLQRRDFLAFWATPANQPSFLHLSRHRRTKLHLCRHWGIHVCLSSNAASYILIFNPFAGAPVLLLSCSTSLVSWVPPLSTISKT